VYQKLFILHPIIIVLTFSLTFCQSTKEEKELDEFSKKFIQSDQPMAIYPETPEDGKDIYVFYNLGNKNARIKFADSLTVTIDINNYHKELKYRYIMKPHSKYKNIYYAQFYIPKDSYFATIQVLPYGVYRGDEYISGAIFKNGEFQKGSLIEMLKGQKNHTDIFDIFKEDEKLFPDYFARYVPYWQMTTLGYADLNNIKNDINTINEIHSNAKNFDSKISSLIALSYGYYLIQEYDSCLKELEDLIILLKKSSNENVKMPDIENLNSFIDLSIKSNDEVSDKILPKIFEIIPLINSYELDKCFGHILYSEFIEIEPQLRCSKFWLFNKFSYEFSNFSNYIIHKVDSTYRNNIRVDFARWVPHLCYEVGEITGCLNKTQRDELFLLGYNIGSKIDYLSTDTITTAYMGAEGITGSMILDLGKSLLYSEQNEKGLQYLKNYISTTPIQRFNNGALSLSAVELTKYYLKDKNIDSSEKYLKLCFYYNSPFSYQLYDSLNTIYKNSNISPKDIHYFTKNQTETILKNITPNFVIKTTRKSYKFNDFKDSLVIIFLLDNTCASCNIGFPTAMAYIVQNYPNIKILIGQNNYEEHKQDLLSDPNLQKFEFITNNDELFNYFKINELPKVLFFKNSTLIEQINSIPTETIAYKMLIEKNN